jgi:hypothetical protein
MATPPSPCGLVTITIAIRGNRHAEKSCLELQLPFFFHPAAEVKDACSARDTQTKGIRSL